MKRGMIAVQHAARSMRSPAHASGLCRQAMDRPLCHLPGLWTMNSTRPGIRRLSSASQAPSSSSQAGASASSSSSSSQAAPGVGEASAGQTGESASAFTDDEMKLRVLEAALEHVPTLGFGVAALNAGAEQLGYHTSGAMQGLFPTGHFAIVEYVMKKHRESMSVTVRQLPIASMSVKDVLYACVRTRLEAQVPYNHVWPAAMAMGLQPAHLSSTLEQLALLVDEMWHIVGDVAVDSTWYTKRALIGGVYSATELYMLTDTSKGYENTWQQLERRLDDLVNLDNVPNEFGAKMQQGTDVARMAMGQLGPLVSLLASHLPAAPSGSPSGMPAGMPGPEQLVHQADNFARTVSNAFTAPAAPAAAASATSTPPSTPLSEDTQAQAPSAGAEEQQGKPVKP